MRRGSADPTSTAKRRVGRRHTDGNLQPSSPGGSLVAQRWKERARARRLEEEQGEQTTGGGGGEQTTGGGGGFARTGSGSSSLVSASSTSASGGFEDSFGSGISGLSQYTLPGGGSHRDVGSRAWPSPAPDHLRTQSGPAHGWRPSKKRVNSLAEMMNESGAASFGADGDSDDDATSAEIAAELLSELKGLMAHAKAGAEGAGGAGGGVLLQPDDIAALTFKVMRISEETRFTERAAKTKERVARTISRASSIGTVPEEFASDVR